MNEAFKECLKNRKIIPFPRAKGLVQKELAAAKDDLAEAKDRLKNGRYKYATINSYYSIFHAARALLYSKGYRERSHHCLSVALEALFVQTAKMRGRGCSITDTTWFTYDDETCDYDCQNSEYIYWALTSILGTQDYPGRLEQIGREWRLNTREKVKEQDPAVYAILTNPEYKLPTVLPDGKYKAETVTIQP